MIATPSLRIDPANPDHHLWNNHGTWWLHYCVVTDPRLKARRVRASLGTRCPQVARGRRDTFLAHLQFHAALGARVPAREARAA